MTDFDPRPRSLAALPVQAPERRRAGLALGGLAMASLCTFGLSTKVFAQAAYPSRPVRVLVGFSAGGFTDVVGRVITQALSERMKQSFVIENKPGAGANIATQEAIRATPDGYTLILNTVGPMAVNPTLYRKLPHDPLNDLLPVAMAVDAPNVLVVTPASGIRSFEAFVEQLKAQPDKLNYASTGIGTAAHLSGFMLTQRVGSSATHVPYKGAEALRDLLAGQVQFMFATIPSCIALIRAERLVPLAVSTAKRSRALPDVPTVAERGFPGFAAGSWAAFYAPRGTPEPVIALLNREINDILNTPSVQQQLLREGAEPMPMTPAQLGQFTRAEFEKWRTVVRASGATAE